MVGGVATDGGGATARLEERDLLVGALDALRDGSGRIVLISGEAGLGKTWLLRELTGIVRARGSRVASAAASDLAGGRPFELLVSMLRSLSIGAAPDVREAAATALTLLSDAGADTSRWAQIDAVVDALLTANSAEPSLVLVALEDLHWADQSTVEVLTQVLQQIEQIPVLVVATFRPPRPGADALVSLTQSIRRLPVSERIDLRPLPEADARALVHAAAAGALAETDIRAIVERAAGNPLFLQEAAREAVQAARAGDPIPSVPAVIGELVRRQIASLPPDAQVAVEALAVMGSPCTPARLASLVDLAPSAVDQAVDALIAEGLARAGSDGAVAFSHAITRDAVYDGITISQRRAQHARCAAVLEGEASEHTAAATARHLLAVGGHEERRRAGAALARAGARSLAQLAYEQAAQQLAEAADLMAATGESLAARHAVRLELAEARRLTRADDLALDTFAAIADEAAAGGDAETEALAAIGYERTYLATARPRDNPEARSIPLLERALARLDAGGASGSLTARVLAGYAQALFFGGRREDALAAAERAVDIARANADPGAEATALNTRRAAIFGPDTLEEALALTRLVVQRAADAGDPDLQLEGLYWEIWALLSIGRRTEADSAVTRFGLIAERIRQPRRLAELHRLHAMMAHLDGDLTTSRAEADTALRIGLDAGNAEAFNYHFAILTVAGSVEERREGARRLLQGMTRDLDQASWQIFVAYMAMEAGDRERAARFASRAMETGLGTIARDHIWLTFMYWFAEVSVSFGDPIQAQAAYEMLAPYADRYIAATNSVCYGSVERLLGKLATVTGSADAAAHFRRAAERNRALGAYVWPDQPDDAGTRVAKTFLFTDIVRSTNLVEAMGDEAWNTLLRWHDDTLRGLFRSHGGEEVVSTGDGFFVAFDSSDDAVTCAIAIQRHLADHRRTTGFAPHVRIGVHATTATEVNDNYRGKGVHEAARIAALAGAGEIVTSASTAGSRATLGPPRREVLKGLAEPVEVVSLVWQ